MSVFGAIRDAIFGKAAASPTHSTSGAPTPQPKPTSAQAPSTGAVDVDSVLAAKAAHASQPLNYKTSIVDLMKLLGLDSSLSHRKELAKELGYTGSLDGSAEMNIWLHKAVMKKLAANGGTVSPELHGA